MPKSSIVKDLALGVAAVILLTPMVISAIIAVKPATASAVTDTFDSSTTWTAPAGVTSATIEAWGAGGGGGGTGSNGKGGGGGGGYSSAVVGVTPGNNYTVTVGVGGAPGNVGGNSQFIATGTVRAIGGGAGTVTAGGSGGSQGSGIGTIKYSGGTGGDQSGNGKGGGGGGGSATQSANGGAGGSANNGGTGGTGMGDGGGGGGNNSSGSNGSPPGGGGGGGGAGGTSGSGANGRIVVTYTSVVISVAISDGTVAYGTQAIGTSRDTTSSGLNDTQTATNDGNVAIDLNIQGQSSANWTLAAAAGSEQYVHQYCVNGGGSPDPCDSSPTWTALTTSYQSMATNIAASGTQKFDLRISTPTNTNTTAQQSVDVTVQAVQN